MTVTQGMLRGRTVWVHYISYEVKNVSFGFAAENILNMKSQKGYFIHYQEA